MRVFILLILNLLLFDLHSQTTIVVESLPNTTPEQDTIFIAGTFNNWKVNDPKYRLHPQLDGKYSIVLPINSGIMEFKFTRGSWLKVETNKSNEFIQNRRLDCSKNKILYAKVQNWQDLGGAKKFNYIMLLLFAIAFYGLFLLYFAFRIQRRTQLFTPYFFKLNSILIICLIGAVIYDQSNLIWQSPIGMIGIIVLFLWGPVFYQFLNSFSIVPSPKRNFTFYFPAIIVVFIAIMRFINFDPLQLYAVEINPGFSWGSCILFALGIISNFFYHLFIYKQLKMSFKKDRQVPKKELFKNISFFISTLSLILFTLMYILLINGISISSFNNFEPVLILLSSILFVEFFYYWKYPEVFHQNEGVRVVNRDYENYNNPNYFLSTKSETSKIPHQSLPLELVDELKAKLKEQMIVRKVFKNPKLNILSLSELIETRPHILSRVLNEQFNKNFRDFINEFRIKEFIELASSEKYKNYTLLALSFEVGFNSKSTFNLAFKKVTHLSPRDFLKNSNISLSD